MADVEAVTWLNDDGLRLFGTLHRPDFAASDLPAVILVSPGAKMRVGPGRLYVPLTDMLVESGCTVLRFDYYGLGDSEGELPETMLADVYRNIELGRYVPDTISALRWMREMHGFDRFILGGLCGGATTAVLTAQKDTSVVGLLSIGMNVTLSSNALTPARLLTEGQIQSRRKQYFRRLLQPKSWLRFLTFRSEYGVIWLALKRSFMKRRRPEKATPARANQPQTDNTNPLFASAFFAFLERGGQAFMLFSEKDRLHSEYLEKFAARFRDRLTPFKHQIKEHVVAEANHVLALEEWRQEMIDLSQRWLRDTYAAVPASTAERSFK